MAPATPLRHILTVLAACTALGAPALRAGETPPVLRRGGDHFVVQPLEFQGRLQSIVVQDFNGDGVGDICLLHYEDDARSKDRTLSIFFQRAGEGFREEPDQSWVVSERATSLMFADVDGRPGTEILLMVPDGVVYHTCQDGRFDLTPTRLLFLETFFPEAQPDALPVLSYPRDFDGDGRHDLLLPTPEGYRLAFQTAPGVFGRFCALPADARRQVTVETVGEMVLEQSLARFEVADFDGDGRSDLIAVEGGGLVVYRQQADGTYPAGPTTKFPFTFARDPERADRIEASFLYFVDINSDGCVDCLVSHTTGEIGVFESVITQIFMFYGRRGGPYPQVPDQIINLPGICLGPVLYDLNGDGRRDLILSSFRTDLLGKAFDALTKKLTVTYYVYLFQAAQGQFSESPDYDRDVDIRTEVVEKGGGIPHVHFEGDFDGDGKNDLMMIAGDSKLTVLPRRTEEERWWKTGVDYKKDEYLFADVKPPKWVEIQDLNKDGRADLLVGYASDLHIYLSK